MPGRVSTRSARPSASSHLSRKSSVPTLNSRASTASRLSTPTTDVPNDGPESELRTLICAIFGDSQRTTAGHRKLVIRLRKIQEQCCYEPPRGPKNRSEEVEQFEEDGFNSEVGRCIIRVLGVKKAEAAGDRVLWFLGLFLKHASDIDYALHSQANVDETQSLPETPTSRLTFGILSLLIPLLSTKEKVVRYRATQIVSHIINTLDSIDDELYHLVRQGLLKRIRDKEPTIRIQAVLGLGRLAGNEVEEQQDDEDSDNDDAGGLLEKLLEVLQHDTSAEVRRSLLLNLPLTPGTLPYLLERARDLDPATRRALYSRLLPTLGDFRHLSLSMREKLLRWGLRDRDENVRKAAGRLFRERWIEDCVGPRAEEDGAIAGQAAPPSTPALLELLERIDIVNSGVDNGIALEAMSDFWGGRPDYRDEVTFEDAFWDNLTPENIFLARSFNDFCRQGPGGTYEVLLEEKMPEVTKLAFYLERYAKALLENIKRTSDEEGAEEEETVEQEFIVEQLLHIALSLDYSDEVGRRKMFTLLRETLAIADLPDEATRLVIEVLRGVCGRDAAGEREFCRVVLEGVAEVHDNIEEDFDESFHSARSEISDMTPSRSKKGRGITSNSSDDSPGGEEDEAKIIREIMINMKCLHIAQCMLQNVEGDLQQNVHLVTMLNNLVVPAVRSHEAPIRERGIFCLGLCCLLDKTLAEENIPLFIHCFSKGHEGLQTTSLQILCDILTTHPSLLTPVDPSSPPMYLKPLLKTLTRALKSASPPSVQSTAASSIAKLMLTNTLQDSDLLKTLVVAYFDPATRANAAMRQALSYFLPVYCHSRYENQERMGSIAVAVVHSVMGIADDLDDEIDSADEGGKSDMVSLTTVVAMLADWTDGRKLVRMAELNRGWEERPGTGKSSGEGVSSDVQLDIVGDVLEKVLRGSCSREEKKVLLSLLSKLYINAAGSTVEKVLRAHDLLDEAVEDGVANDSAGKNALVKLRTATAKVATVEGGNKTVLEPTAVEVAGEDGEGDGETKLEGTVMAAAEETGNGSAVGGVRDAGEDEETEIS